MLFVLCRWFGRVNDIAKRHRWVKLGLHHTKAPTPAALDRLGRKYRPFRTVVAWYCWQARAHPETLSAVFPATWTVTWGTG